MSRQLRRLGSQFSISIPTDAEGYLGRECEKCKSYFKITPGTGIEGVAHCICPYCGHKADTSDFATPEQIEYAQSVVMKQVMGAVDKDLKDMARSFNRKASGGLFSMKMNVRSRPSPIRYYAEKDLETPVECSECSLRYAIYGVFGFCPDCGAHNSLQILEKNLELARKQIALAEKADDDDLKTQLIGDALENAVSAFDGFGREAAAAKADLTTNPTQVQKLSFQNLASTDAALQSLFGFSLGSGVSVEEWTLLVRCFQKRHLLAHKMGVVDEKYIAATGDSQSVEGRKIRISADEVASLIDAVATLGVHLVTSIANSARDNSPSNNK